MRCIHSSASAARRSASWARFSAARARFLVPESGLELPHLVQDTSLELPQFLHARVMMLSRLFQG